MRDDALDIVEAYDPISDTWTRADKFEPTPVAMAMAVASVDVALEPRSERELLALVVEMYGLYRVYSGGRLKRSSQAAQCQVPSPTSESDSPHLHT